MAIHEDKMTFTPKQTVEMTYDVLVDDQIISAYESMLEAIPPEDTEN